MACSTFCVVVGALAVVVATAYKPVVVGVVVVAVAALVVGAALVCGPLGLVQPAGSDVCASASDSFLRGVPPF